MCFLEKRKGLMLFFVKKVFLSVIFIAIREYVLCLVSSSFTVLDDSTRL